MHKKPIKEKLSGESSHDWDNLKLMLLEDALSKESNKEILFVGKFFAIQDLISEMNARFSRSFSNIVCNLTSDKKAKHADVVNYTLNPTRRDEYADLVEKINHNPKIKLVALQYELSLFPSLDLLSQCLAEIKKPVVTIFDSLLSASKNHTTETLAKLINTSNYVVVHTAHEVELAVNVFGTEADKMFVLPSSPAAFAHLFKKILGDDIALRYNLPTIQTNAIVRKYQSKIGVEESLESSSTHHSVDIDLQAITAMCMQYEATKNLNDLNTLTTHIRFVSAYFNPTELYENLSPEFEITIGKAICNLGFLYSRKAILPNDIAEQAETILLKTLKQVDRLQSPCAIGYSIKGLYYYFIERHSFEISKTIERLGDKIASLYIKHASISWSWFEQHITYTNCILSEALLLAYLASHKAIYKKIAINAFDFLLIKAFNENSINAISSENKFIKKSVVTADGINPTDVASIIQSLSTFYDVFKDETYLSQMEIAFSWFLGNNHLYYSFYDTATGKMNMPPEQTFYNTEESLAPVSSYVISRLVMERYFKPVVNRKIDISEKVKTRNITSALRSGVVLNYFVKFSVMIMVVLLMIRKIFAPTKRLQPALFER
jgi:hypothetical protein